MAQPGSGGGEVAAALESLWRDLRYAVRSLQARLAAIPGVTSAGTISHQPYDDLPTWALT